MGHQHARQREHVLLRTSGIDLVREMRGGRFDTNTSVQRASEVSFMMWPGYGWGFGAFGWIMPIVGIVVLGLVIWVIVMLFRRGSGGCCGVGQSTTESALDILKKRYAYGEIGKEEFEEKKRALS